MAVKTINGEKCYPFNGRKHMHDIDFAIVRCENLMWDAKEDGDMKRLKELSALHGHYCEALQWCEPHGVGYMPYRVWKWAKEASEWAQHERASRCAEAGIDYIC